MKKIVFLLTLLIGFSSYCQSRTYESVAQIVANKTFTDYDESYQFMFRGRYLTVFYDFSNKTEIFNLFEVTNGELKYRSTSTNGYATISANWNVDGYGNTYYDTPVYINVNTDYVWFNGTVKAYEPSNIRSEYYQPKITTEKKRQNSSNSSSPSNDPTKIWKYFDYGDLSKTTINSKEGLVLELGYDIGGQSEEPLYFVLSSARSKRKIRWYENGNARFHFNNDEFEYKVVNKDSSEEWDSEGTNMMRLSSFISSNNPEEKIELIEMLELFKKYNSVTFNITTTNSDLKSFTFSLKGSSQGINNTIPFHSEMLEQLRCQKEEQRIANEEQRKANEESKPWWKFWDF